MTPSLAKLGQMAGHRAPGRPCGRGKRADRGEAPAGAISEADEVLQRPVQMPADGAVDVKCNRDKGKHGASGVQRTRLEAADFGRTLPVHAKGLAKIGRFGKSRCRQTYRDFAGPAGMQTRLPRRVLLYGCLSCGLA